MKILLIEPDYKNKYPPLGLMKISTFHKQRGDEVVFCKGNNKELKQIVWDRIYISTLFTFYWNKVIKTIEYYYKSVKTSKNIFLGGVMATLKKEELQKCFDITVVSGLLNEKGKIRIENDYKIDSLVPDYSIINQHENEFLNYKYPIDNAYFVYSTRGCIRKCEFCAVPIIEGGFKNGVSILKQVNDVKETFGERKDLLFLDNNILASNDFEKIINEIKQIGYEKGAKYSYMKNNKKSYKLKYVDFNQGIDARLLTKNKIKLLSEIAVSPLRIAFDDIKFQKVYIEKVRLAADFNIPILSNYILFNFKDTPQDFYQRLKINIRLNTEFESKKFKTKIWSFPMKFSPIFGDESKNRKYIGKNWNKKYLRGIQCILLATHGVVGPKKLFFEAAFGKSYNEFENILMLPEKYIINRKEYRTESQNLLNKISTLLPKQKKVLMDFLKKNEFRNINKKSFDLEIYEILKHYEV
ncbi:MAG TPA: cobalamin-binding domain-containing protein [Spirochaetota bacterium]|nr:cobalamin-binding domain-containing protein [Spirochaetota bacterium]HPN29496.1 cobalamin-binding domain-containing protein [bacterium]HPN29517.1 cobalamin-binding domain-containing protein [bacterium]